MKTFSPASNTCIHRIQKQAATHASNRGRRSHERCVHTIAAWESTPASKLDSEYTRTTRKRVNCRACHGLVLVSRFGVHQSFHLMDRGPAHRSHLIFKLSRSRPGPSNFQNYRPGSARPIILAPRPTRHGLYTSQPAISLGRSMCCPVLECACICADTYFFIICYIIDISYFCIPWASCFRSPKDTYTHTILLHTTLLHGPMRSAPTGGPPPPSAAATPAAAAAAAAGARCCCNTCYRPVLRI